jgi:hypothetical protein
MKKRIIIMSLLAGGMLLLGSAAMAGQPKVLICHAPPGNPSNAQTISVAAPAVPAHLAHGDIACTCAAIDGCTNPRVLDANCNCTCAPALVQACEARGGTLNETCDCIVPESAHVACQCPGVVIACRDIDVCNDDIAAAFAAEVCPHDACVVGTPIGVCVPTCDQ